MKVVLVNPRGFCAGVVMAVKCLDRTLRELGAPIYVYHEIVHNRHVVEQFQARGAIFVDDVEDVPGDAVLVFSAWDCACRLRACESPALVDHRCHLSAGSEGAHGSRPIREAGLHDSVSGARRSR